MSGPYHNSLVWKIGIEPEVEKLLSTVNPNWRTAHYITTEFYLDPVVENPKEFPFFAASPKSRQKWYITFYLHSVCGWYSRTERTKTSVSVNPIVCPSELIRV